MLNNPLRYTDPTGRLPWWAKDQRYQCTVGKKTFVESRSTPFYWLRHPTEWFTSGVTLMA